MSTGAPWLLESMTNFANSVSLNHAEADRPSFTYTYDNITGAIEVKIKDGFTPTKVVMQHSQTL